MRLPSVTDFGISTDHCPRGCVGWAPLLQKRRSFWRITQTDSRTNMICRFFCSASPYSYYDHKKKTVVNGYYNPKYWWQTIRWGLIQTGSKTCNSDQKQPKRQINNQCEYLKRMLHRALACIASVKFPKVVNGRNVTWDCGNFTSVTHIQAPTGHAPIVCGWNWLKHFTSRIPWVHLAIEKQMATFIHIYRFCSLTYFQIRCSLVFH